MLGETYDIKPSPDKGYYLFTSEGPKGRINKIVLFQWLRSNRYNLAFGDITKSAIDDEVVSDNQDFVKVLSTVTACVYDFIKTYPGITLEVTPVDERRRMLYNAVFRRHYISILERFVILGIADDVAELYSPEKSYERFELNHII